MVDDTGFDEFMSRISKTLYYGDKFHEEDHLSYPVIELAAEIYSDLKTGKSIDRLYLNEATEITRRVKVNPCYLVLALLYIDRLKDCYAEYLDNVAPSQLFLISLVLASKFHADGEYELSLSMFEKFSEWTQSEVFGAELAFLDALQWNTHVTEDEFYTKLVELESCLARRLGGRRGWFTYTEMNTLLDPAWLTHVTQLLTTVSCVCLSTYTAGIFTLLASSSLASMIVSSLSVCSVQRINTSTPIGSTHLEKSCHIRAKSEPFGTSLASKFLASLFLTSRLDDSSENPQVMELEDLLEEEIEGFVSENRIGDLLARLEQLDRLPGNVNGCGGLLGGRSKKTGGIEKTGLHKEERYRESWMTQVERGTETFGRDNFKTDNLGDLLVSGLSNLFKGIGKEHHHLELDNLGRLEEDMNFINGHKDWMTRWLEWLRSPSGKNQDTVQKRADTLYTYIPNSTSFLSRHQNEAYCNSIMNQFKRQNIQEHSKTSIEIIPTVSPSNFTVTPDSAEPSLFEYFHSLPLHNVTNFLFANDFDWNLYDRNIKRNNFGWVKIMDLKF